jgi:hypothetical protein
LAVEQKHKKGGEQTTAAQDLTAAKHKTEKVHGEVIPMRSARQRWFSSSLKRRSDL